MMKVCSIKGECENEDNKKQVQSNDILDGLISKSSG